jgi:XTP/dITP diphosphohydrolase
MTLLFASHNHNKSKEISAFLDASWSIQNLHDLGIYEEIPETGVTLKENALIKAQYLFDRYKQRCFADDSGLEVTSLGNQPGVYSARYAGVPKDDDANMNLLLKNLSGQSDRSAQFKTVIAYIDENETPHFFEGTVQGKILTQKIGTSGFGYDPIFQPNGYDISFAQMDLKNKNAISHRTRAVKKMAEYLNTKA